MKKILIGLGVVVVVLIAAALIVPAVIPVDTYKERLSAEVKKATGRDLVIAGPVSLSVLPRLALEAGDVRFSNAPGAKAADMAALKTLRLKLGLWRLISGNVEVDEFVLIDPVVNLEVDARGRPNWTFGETADDQPAASATAPGTAHEAGGGPSAIRLGDVRIVNGVFTYTDAAQATTETLSDVDVTVALPSLDREAEIEGSLVWKGERITLAAKAEAPRALTAGGTTAVEVKIESAHIALDYDGTVTMGATSGAKGKVALNIPSLRALLAWAATPLPEGEGFGPLSIAGTVDAMPARIAFTGATIAFDAMKGEGALTLDLAGARPRIEARLALDKVDINPYLAKTDGTAAGGGASAGGGGGGGAAAPADWSDDPIDMSALTLADAKLVFETQAIHAQAIRIGPTALAVDLAGGKLDARLEKMALYGGTGTARIRLDGAAAIPRLNATLDLAEVQAKEFMTDAMGLDRIEGTASATAEIASTGVSQRALIQALGGKAEVRFLDGAIVGIDLAAMARNVSSAFLNPNADERQKTDFAELSGTFDIARGIMTNRDLVMKAPFLRLDGTGTVDLPARRLDYRLTPKLVSTMKGQGGRDNARGVTVPVLVSGPWHDLSYQPDLAGVVEDAIKDPAKLRETIDSLRGGGGSGEGGASLPKPGDVLKNLLGR